MFGRFDPSVGAQSQKTPKHPIGDSSYNLAQHEREARENRDFRDRELALKRAMLAQIKEGIEARWG